MGSGCLLSNRYCILLHAPSVLNQWNYSSCLSLDLTNWLSSSVNGLLPFFDHLIWWNSFFLNRPIIISTVTDDLLIIGIVFVKIYCHMSPYKWNIKKIRPYTFRISASFFFWGGGGGGGDLCFEGNRLMWRN